MRLVRTDLSYEDVKPQAQKLMDRLSGQSRQGSEARVSSDFQRTNSAKVVERGARWAVKNGYGWQEDLDLTEEFGRKDGADVDTCQRKGRGTGVQPDRHPRLGNHYLEVQVLRKENIYNEKLAQGFGLFLGQIVLMFHCGSRGFGHQVATDYLQLFLRSWRRNTISSKRPGARLRALLPPEGQDYFSAMRAA